MLSWEHTECSHGGLCSFWNVTLHQLRQGRLLKGRKVTGAETGPPVLTFLFVIAWKVEKEVVAKTLARLPSLPPDPGLTGLQGVWCLVLSVESGRLVTGS